MRVVPAAITAARQSSSSRLCKIWRIERTDGTVYRFTEHDRDLTIGGETFLATASFDPSTIKASSDLSVDDLDVQGAFDSDYITPADLLAGRFNGAKFYVAEVLWSNPAAGMDVLRSGRLGTIKESGGKFVAELLGPTVLLQNPIGDLYSATCRATLGDAMCGVDMGPHTFAGTVAGAASRRVFTVTGGSPDWLATLAADASYFQHGVVTFTSGANAGLGMEVFSFDGSTATLLLSLPFDIAIGDTFTIKAGCDHSRPTCKARFENILRMQAEPDVPVSDDVIKGPVRGVDEGVSSTNPWDGPQDDDSGGGGS